MRILTSCEPKDVPRIINILGAKEPQIVSLRGDVPGYQTKIIKCPEDPSSARTAIYLMQMPKTDTLILEFNLEDPELVDLALSFGVPVFASVIRADYQVDLKKFPEEDF